MEFKSLFFDSVVQVIQIKPAILSISDEFDISETKLFDDGFLCFRIERNHSVSKYGVESKESNDHIPLYKAINKRDIVTQDFIIIDQQKKDVYYTGSKAIAEEVVNEYLRLPKGCLSSRVSLDSLAIITEIKVVEYPIGQMSIFEQGDECQVNREISDLFNESDPYEKITRTYTMKGGRFKRNKLIDLVNKRRSDGLRKYTIEGKDTDGNFVKFSDGAFARKYDIFQDDMYQKYEVRKAMTLQEIKEALKKVIK